LAKENEGGGLILGPTKCCTKCRLVKLATLEFFGPNSRKKDGLWEQCRDCLRKYNREYVRDRYRKCPEFRAYRKQINQNNELMRLYGITPRQRDEMLAAQGGGCAICGRRKKVMCVDHCHSTGQVRGVLCNGCNLSIGQLGDTPARLKRAAEYLAKAVNGKAAAA
jgi:hypothetical protein